MRVFRTQTLAAIKKDIEKTHLKKDLGVTDLLLLGLGGIIGIGIFVLTGLAAAQYAGPAITLSFIIGGIACIFTALAYAELGAMLPVSGSTYTYVYATLGEGIAAFVGWVVVMLYTYGAATVAAGWSGYVLGIFDSIGIHFSPVWTKIPSQGGWINLPAVFIVCVLTLLLIRGTKEATKLNGILVFVKIAAIFWFLFAAVPHIDAKNWEVFAPHGFFGVAAGAGFVFMSYTGFDTLVTAAEECRNPNRDLPIAIIGSLLGSAILYVAVSGVLTAIAPYASLNNPEPMTFALRQHGVHIGAKLVATGAIAGMTTVILSQIFGQSRILFVMARDGLMPPIFTRLNKRFASPHFGLIFSGMLMAAIAGFVPVGTLGQLSSMSTLLAFSFVSLSVMIMRFKKPNEHRPFRCPAVYGVATVSALLCLFLFAQLLPENWKPFLFSSVVGIFIYAVYGFRHSKMNHHK